MEKSVIRLFEVPHREASPARLCISHSLAHSTHMLWQPGGQDSCKQIEEKYPQRHDIDVLFMSERERKKNTKMIHLKPLKPGDNPHACGAALGELGMRKPLYIPLRSTWLNRWYICMLICLISLLQMSYRHIKGLTLRHNDIRASDGGAYENMRQP